MTAEHEESYADDDAAFPWVPDGEPCPTHGLPTRLIQVPNAGLVSQCALCREAFFAWHDAQLRRGITRPADAIPVAAAIPLVAVHDAPLSLFGSE